jgi:hypothetical protein
MWVAHLYLHHLEALVQIHHQVHTDRLASALLQGMTLESSNLEQLDQRLFVGRQILTRSLHHLQAAGLVEVDAEQRWLLTPLGRRAREQGFFPVPRLERRSFHFVEAFHRSAPPHYLPLKQPGFPWRSGAGWSFDVRYLRECLGHSEDWKRRHQFPLDVEELITEKRDIPEWQTIILDRPEFLLTVMVRSRTESEERLLGWPVDPMGWTLTTMRPVLDSGPSWPEAFPELAQELPQSSWFQAWKTWCRTAHVPADQAEACVIEGKGVHLQVRVPASLMSRLRAGRHEVLKGTIWLLAGGEDYRQARLIEIL